LLVFDVLVIRKQNVPFSLSEREQLAVLLTAEANFADGFAFVAERS
jgi:hypothetical protein